MKKTLILMLTIFIMSSSLNIQSYADNTNEWDEAAAPIFSDTQTHWGREYIELLQMTDIISGYPDGTFKPDSSIRVDEFLVLCIKSLGVSVDTSNNDTDYWAYPFVDYGLKNNLVDESYKTFDRPIIREEMAMIAIKTIEKNNTYSINDKEALIEAIKDVEFISDNNIDAVLKAYSIGLISGNPDKRFYPSGTATRAEASVVVLRLVNPDERKPYVIEEEVVEETNPSDNNIPSYLQNRFTDISTMFNLTWTDEDFEDWYNKTSDEEKNNYFNQKKAPPVFDFENKYVLLAMGGQQSHVQENLQNLNDYNDILPLDYFGSIAYEMYKMNIEKFVKDGEDYGQIYITQNLENDGLTIEVKDSDSKGNINRCSFRTVIKTTNGQGGSYFLHYLKDQWDYDIDTTYFMTVEEHITPYVNDSTHLNYLLLHGIDEGQILFDNYMDAFEQRMIVGLASTPNSKLNIETNNYTVEHMNISGWWLKTILKGE